MKRSVHDESVLTAEKIGEAARTDPQLRVPLRPRVRRGLVFDFEEGQVAVEGGPKRQLLRGRAATDILPRLLELLDGHRDHEQLAEALQLPIPKVFKVLALLWTCGVIEEGPPETPLTSPVDPSLADFLSRISDSTGVNLRWEDAIGRLSAAKVEVFGEGPAAESVRRELGASLEVELGKGSLPRADTTFVLQVDSGEDFQQLTETCWKQGLPLLRFRIMGRTALLGPLVVPGTTACLHCQTTEDVLDQRTPAQEDIGLAAALMSRDLFAMLSRSTPTPLPMRWRMLDMETLEQEQLSATTRPGCGMCSIADGPMEERAPLAARFESSIAFPPKEFADPKAHQAHYKPSNIALQLTEKAWPSAPTVELPVPVPERLAKNVTEHTNGQLPSEPVSADDLALLLLIMVGPQHVAPNHLWRWTASGGNIGSAVAYLVVRDVTGITPGIYGYVSSGNRLARLSSVPDAIPGTAPLSVVLTGDFTTVARKYSTFALRIVLLDSGCVQAAAKQTALALGISFALQPRWDDMAVARALNIDPDTEPVTAVIDFGGDR